MEEQKSIAGEIEIILISFSTRWSYRQSEICSIFSEIRFLAKTIRFQDGKNILTQNNKQDIQKRNQ
jgi:hypothetical protein